MATRMKRIITFRLFLVLALLAANAVPTLAQVHSDVPVVSPEQKAVACSLESCFSAIARKTEAGVVSITAAYKPGFEDADSRRSEDLQEFFRRFLDSAPDLLSRGPRSILHIAQETASGSGVIVRRDGADFYILTNYHVVDGAYTVAVRLAGATDLRGTVIGVDPVTDLAVVRVKSSALSNANVIPLGDSDTVKVGAWVVAMGSPFGFEHTVTVGIVSAVQRQLEDEETQYLNLIQTDAAINKGNSGGPLLDIEGRVIGINAAIASPTGGFIGLGFAIPINIAREVLDKLITDGRVVRGWIGIGIQEVTPVFAEFYGVKQGVLVAAVDEKGPASFAGLKVEDIVTDYDGRQVTSVYDLQRMVANSVPNSHVTVSFIREGQPRRLSVRVRESPSTPKGRPTAPANDRKGPGFDYRAMTPEIAKRIGLTMLVGVIVTSVQGDSVASEAGLEPGDVILSLNRRQVGSYRQFAEMWRMLQPGDIVVLKVLRAGETRFIGFRREQGEGELSSASGRPMPAWA